MKVLVLGVGAPAGANTCRALRAAGHHVVGYEANPLHRSFAQDHTHWLIDELTVDAINAANVDVVIPQPDPLVSWLAEQQGIKPRMLQPASGVIDVCQMKPLALRAFCDAGLRQFDPVLIGRELPDWLHVAKDRFGLPFWLRATRGAGGRGSVLVETLAQGFHWLRFWNETGRDIDFVAEEFLPGRDYSWTGIYHGGTLVASFARERVEYIYPALSVSGITGTPTVATVVHDRTVNDTAERAVAAVDMNPNGVYNVDLREDSSGVPRPTEINAGRFNTTIGAWSSLTGVNLADLWVRLAADGPRWWLRRPDLTEPPARDCMRAGLTLARHVDLPARLVAH